MTQTDQERLGTQASTHTLFGQLRYLETVTQKLYRKDICYGKDIEKLTETEFFDIVGPRTRPNVKKMIKDRMSELGLRFHP